MAVHDLEIDRSRIAYAHDGATDELECDFIAGCDGICRPSIPAGVLTEHEYACPFAWLGILADWPDHRVRAELLAVWAASGAEPRREAVGEIRPLRVAVEG